MRHALTTTDVEDAVNELVLNRSIILASSSCEGGRKVLSYMPGTKVFTVEATGKDDFECGTAEMAATVYTERG